MRKIITFSLFCLFGNLLMGQHVIKGILIDEEEAPLPSATVMLLNAQDSVLKSFAMSKADGSFELRAVPEGDFLLQATYSTLEKLSKEVKVTGETKEIDLGQVMMVQKSTELEATEITAELIPVQIKGDTIEYNADAFKTQPNSRVEDLLKRLPGVEVDQDGNVTAQGETVNKVLVDGKEFFGNDPKVATKNLPADAVDKVEVFDKRSDMADFTGVDDGNLTRTINLRLKEDRKNGIFGDVMAGYGTKDRFRSKANLNRFTPKSQLSFLGMANNINEQAFSINDYVNFMGGVSNLMSMRNNRQGSSSLLSPSDLGISRWGNASSTRGITTSAAAGLNFNQDIGKKTELSTSYFYNYLNSDLTENTLRENILEQQSFVTDDSTNQDDRNHNHRLNLRVKHEIDSTSQLVLNGAGRFNLVDGYTNTQTLSLFQDQLQNANLRTETTDGQAVVVNADILYLKKFKKRGRSLAVQGILGIDQQDKDFGLDAILDTLGVVADTLRQNQIGAQNILNFGGVATYTEPIGRNKYLEASYSHEEYHNELDKDFFNLVNPETSVFDSSLSNRYDGVFRFDQGKISLRHVTKKSNLQLGVAAQYSELDGTVGLMDTDLNKTFFNVLPSLNWRYMIKKGSSLRFRYQTQVNAPTIEQLQPVVDNSNPLSLFVGNPDLRAEYAHSANLHYMIFDQFSFTSFFTMLRATYTLDKISTATTVDSLFRQNTTYVNVARDLNLMWFAAFGTPIRKLGVKINLRPRVSWTNTITLINNVENPTNRLTPSIDASIENRKKEVVDFRVGANFSYNRTTYEIDSQMDQTYLNSRYYSDLTIYLPKKFTLNGNFSYSVYSGGNLSQNQSFPLLTAYLSKTFLKRDQAELRLSTFDVLNQNLGIDRSTSINYLEETRYNTLSRYYMLSFTWKFLTIPKG